VTYCDWRPKHSEMSSIKLPWFLFIEGQNIAKCLLSSYNYFFLLKVIVTLVKVTFKIYITPVGKVGPIYCMVRAIWLGCNDEKSIITYWHCQVTGINVLCVILLMNSVAKLCNGGYETKNRQPVINKRSKTKSFRICPGVKRSVINFFPQTTQRNLQIAG
jgi:hypothetical protein